MKSFVAFIFTAMVALTANSSFAGDPVIIVNSNPDNWVTAEYLDTCMVGKQEMLAAKFKSDRWTSLNVHSDPRVTHNRGVWMRVVVDNRSEQEDWIIEFPDAHLSVMELYELDSGQIKSYGADGASVEFKNRTLRHKNFWYQVKIPANSKKTFYGWFESTSTSIFVLSVRDLDFILNYALQEYYFLGVFYGILLIILIYHIILYIRIRRQEFLTYSLYVVGCSFYAFGEDLVGYHIAWSEMPWFNRFLELGSSSLMVLTFCIFTYSYLNLKSLSPRNGILILALGGLSVITLILKNFIPQGIFEVLLIAPHIYGLVLAIKLRKHNRHAFRFFAIGLFVILAGLINFSGIRLGLWYGITENYYLFYFGLLIQVVLMSAATIEKWRNTEKEKEKTQNELIDQLRRNEALKDKVNRELEEKVAERTVQLQEKTDDLLEANKQLEDLTDQLNVLNAQLDKSNWELQKDVKKQTSSRILSEAASYNEFIKLFPDNEACLKFLADRKWADGYKCRKCGNQKFGRSEKVYSRKCTKCKYAESPLVDTIFQGVKFPLNKAFFILYDKVEVNDKKTVDQLAELLQLRRNTCWGFRKRVEEKIEENPDKRTWEEHIW